MSNLKKIRKQKKLTQLDVAIGSGISVTWIQFAEKQYPGISHEAKTKIANFLKCSIEDIWPKINE